MKLLIAAGLVAVTLLLSIIAFDLHQLARTAGVMTGTGAYAVKMTPEQLRRAIQQSDADADTILKAFATTPKKTTR